MNHRLRPWAWMSAILLLAGLMLLGGCVPPTGPIVPARTPAPSPAQASTNPSPQAGTLTLWIEPEAGVEPVVTALDDAEASVRLKLYNLTNAEVIQALKDAAARGVDVRVMVEINPYGGGSTTALLVPELREAGIQFKPDPRTFKYLHEKSLVVDDAQAFIMTANMTSSAVTANREYLVRTTDPEHVREVAAVFDADWERQPIDLTDSLLHWAPDNSRQRILALLNSAQESLWIEHQNMADLEVIRHLVDAVERGVDVRIISSPVYPLAEDTDEPGREQLRQAGAQVRYLDDPYIHAKVFIVDGRRAFVGSQNFTTNSLDNNRELGIDFSDSGPVAQMVAQFEADWQQASEEAFPDADKPVPPVVDHTDADKYYYHDGVTVELTVARIYRNPNGSVIWLMGDQDEESNFKAVFFPRVWPAFVDQYGAEPDEAFTGKTIRVTGLIEKYRGWPEIIVDELAQVEVVE